MSVGESVPESERMIDKELLASDTLSASSSTHNLPGIAQSLLGVAAAHTGVSDDERLTWEQERQKLYLQLDEKVRCYISKVNTDIAVRNWNYHSAMGNHMPYIITQCYLPPGSGDFPRLSPQPKLVPGMRSPPTPGFKKLELQLRVKVRHWLVNLCDCDSVLSERCRHTNSQDF